MIGQFGARIEGNIKLSKFFDEMRLLRSLRPLRLLRLLRSLRPLRFLMPGKSLNVQSARCHTQQKCISKLKTLKIFLKVALHLVHSNSFLQNIFWNFYIPSYRGQETLKK